MISAPDQFLHLFEHSPWVVQRAFAHAPFADILTLHQALLQTVAAADPAAQLALIRAHPELAAREVPLTEASTAEQQGAGLRALSPEDFARFATLNAAYREKFGFPFIICVREHSKAGILEEFSRRLGNDPATERAAALAEIGKITWLRLQDMVAA